MSEEPDAELLAEPPAITSRHVTAALLEASKRFGQAVPIRVAFVQQGSRGRRHPGPLAGIVKARDEFAFDLYMLVLLAVSAPPHDIARHSAVWLRAMDRDPGSKSAASVLSRAWRRLADRGLVHRSRVGRKASIRALREDGSLADYTYPDGTNGDYYLKLPFTYWEDDLHHKLGLPAKAMLLVALAEQDGFSLPYDKVPGWYGLSADTAQRGLRQLAELGIVHVTTGYKAAPLTAQGWTEDRRYSVDPKYRVRPGASTPPATPLEAVPVAAPQPTPRRRKKPAPGTATASSRKVSKPAKKRTPSTAKGARK